MEKKMKRYKIAAIVLLILQAVSLVGSLAGGGFVSGNIFFLFGYFLPTIIAVILLVKYSKMKKQAENAPVAPVQQPYDYANTAYQQMPTDAQYQNQNPAQNTQYNANVYNPIDYNTQNH